MNEAFPQQTGIKPQFNNIDRWLEQLKETTYFTDFAEKELNIIAK